MGLTLVGLYEIDSGLNPTDDDDPAIGHMMAYADLNSDMYTDIIALNEDPSVLNLFYFNPKHLRFYLGNQVKTTDCKQIFNVAVGRSFSHLRLFVTCEASSGSTIVRFFDRKDDGYVEVPKYFTIESNSHPFVGDLNGDFLDDLMFTDVSGGIKIAFQVVMVGEETFVIRDFAAAIPLAKPEPGCLTPVASNRLTSPHSVTMIDFDGDCMSDLFVTVQDSNSGAKFYEIWLRRET